MSVEDTKRAWDIPNAPLHPLMNDIDELNRVAHLWSEFASRFSPPGSTVLDYGCGNGRVMKALEEAGYSAWGYEPSSYNAGRAIENGIDPERLRVSYLAKFDTVMILAVLIHYNQDDGLEVLSDAFRRVKDGGVLIANIVFGDRHDTSWNEINVWDRSAVDSIFENCVILFEDSGFIVVRKP